MLKKRLIGVVTVHNGLAVQSFGYNRYLPLGKPEILVENLDRWGADEILVQCIDRSIAGIAPDFKLLERIGKIGISTPLIYAGGLRGVIDAARAIKLGADRIAVDSMFRQSPDQLPEISKELGSQALIVNLPIRIEHGTIRLFNYKTRSEERLSDQMQECLSSGWVSEIMLSDWIHDGYPEAFDETLIEKFPIKNMPLIIFGGLSTTVQVQRILEQSNVVAAAIGNFLCYKEHALQSIKKELKDTLLRAAIYNLI